ncbi:wings apart-like protein regulation of heterochromatin-domain-containing protein [Nemania sp. FL0916]|nr:wings apart-like protein regulation of heterochromatin-domain-containing protein [Nemania sp. FL0916]
MMGSEYELGAQRKRRMVTTYGKATKKRQPKSIFTSVAASESISDEDPLAMSDAAVPRREPSRAPLSKPKPKPPSTRFRSIDATRNPPTMPTSFPNTTTFDRKRKAPETHKPRERSQPVTDESGEDSPFLTKSNRTRITQAGKGPAAKLSSGDRDRACDRAGSQERGSSSSMRTRAVGPRLSSPPPTPPPPKISKPVDKPSPRVPSQKLVNAPAAESVLPQPVQRQHQLPLHAVGRSTLKPKPSTALPARGPKERVQPPSTGKTPSARVVREPRKRLIDALVEQESTDENAMSEDATDTQATSSQAMFSQSSNTSELDNQDAPETPKPKTRTAPAMGARTFVRSRSALRFTYGEGRKVLEEEDNLLESLVFPQETSYSRRLDLGKPTKVAPATGAFDFDDDGTINNSPGSKLKGIHELRQAGANSRVADAMQDLIDQIGASGTNSSGRRAALLQVAEKMRDKTFIRQCLDHGVESILLKDAGKETNTICAYLILSSLVTIIASGLSTRIGQLICAEEAGPMFARLISIGEDIKKVARDRKSNLSKRSQVSIAAVEDTLRGLPIWDKAPPSYISPRILAIKCLERLLDQDILIGRDPAIFTEAVTAHLFEVLSEAKSDLEYWKFPKTAQSIEFYSALLVLDIHAASVTAAQGGNSEWAIHYLPIIADAFYASLRSPSADNNTMEILILKLTINMTNNNLAAPGIFASKELLAALTISIASNFKQALALVTQDTGAEGILTSLVLRLGILINFAEHSSLVRQIVNDCRHEEREPVKQLIELFMDHHRRTGEADSMEKTHLNVAFGYLAVLLGYLVLHKPVRHKFQRCHPAGDIRPLIGSIREFIAHNQQVDYVPGEDDAGDRRQGNHTEGLQELVQQLERENRN